eukprot:2045253-Rhodomonas_salina.1
MDPDGSAGIDEGELRVTIQAPSPLLPPPSHPTSCACSLLPGMLSFSLLLAACISRRDVWLSLS